MTVLARVSRALQAEVADLLTGDDAADTRMANTRMPNTHMVNTQTPAAVLVPIVDRAEPGLLLTRRTDTLRHHAGQIAFPGGRMEPGETARDAALREAYEEVGLDPGQVRIVGPADPYWTVTGFAVTPVVGIIPPGLPLVPGDGEVAELFEVPLAFVTNAANHAVRTMDWQGASRSYYEIVWRDRRIWGATAAMIVNLARRLRAGGTDTA